MGWLDRDGLRLTATEIPTKSQSLFPYGCFLQYGAHLFLNSLSQPPLTDSCTGDRCCIPEIDCACALSGTPCTNGANGQPCVNNGQVSGAYFGSDTSTCSCTCTAGYIGTNCETPCTAVTNSLAGTALTCTSVSDSQVNACAIGYWKDETGAADVCTTCPAVTNSLAGTALTCTSVSDSQINACAIGYWKDETGAADVCTPCPAVANSLANTALTCSSATNSQIVACASGYWKVTTGAADVCAVCTAVPNAATVTCTSATNSVASACHDEFVLASGACIGKTCGYKDGNGGAVTCDKSQIAKASTTSCTSCDDSSAEW